MAWGVHCTSYLVQKGLLGPFLFFIGSFPIFLREQGWCHGVSTCLPPMWSGFDSMCGLSLLVVFVPAKPTVANSNLCRKQWWKSHSMVFVPARRVPPPPPTTSSKKNQQFQILICLGSNWWRATMWICYWKSLFIIIFFLFYFDLGSFIPKLRLRQDD